MKKMNEVFGPVHPADASTEVHCQAAEHTPCFAMCCHEWSAKYARPGNSPPATISEWIFVRTGGFAMIFKELHGSYCCSAILQ
jgi:hypothetical protein